MNAYIAPAQTPAPTRRHRATAPWVLALLSPVTFVVLMETLEGIAMSGSGPEIRRGDRGKPWVPTILSMPFVIGLVVMVVAAIVAGLSA